MEQRKCLLECDNIYNGPRNGHFSHPNLLDVNRDKIKDSTISQHTVVIFIICCKEF